LSINPIGSIPVLTEKSDKVVGHISGFLNYLSQMKGKVSKYCPKEYREVMD